MVLYPFRYISPHELFLSSTRFNGEVTFQHEPDYNFSPKPRAHSIRGQGLLSFAIAAPFPSKTTSFSFSLEIDLFF